MRPGSLPIVSLLLLVVVAAGLLAPAGSAGAVPAAASTSPLQGNVSGPARVATSANATFFLNASGGPADSGGRFTGNISYSATLVGANLTGTSVAPSSGNISSSTTQPVRLTVTTGAVAETLRLVVVVKSVLGTSNASVNLSTSFAVVVPYVVQATLVAGAEATVLPFNVTVVLDGTLVGTVEVPSLAPNTTYRFAFRCPSAGLATGTHTFTLSVADAHGLVTFANGLTVETVSFYVAPAAPNNTVWYVAGIVAFFGVLFIFATRVAARRSRSARR